MNNKRLTGRPLMTGPLMLRRGTVVGEVRIYQELIKLAAEKTRKMQERRMWSQKSQGIEAQLHAIDSYQKDLFARLNLSHYASMKPVREKERDVPEQKENEEVCSNGAMKLQF